MQGDADVPAAFEECPQEVPDTIKFFKIIEMKHESHDDAERVEKLKEIK